MFYLELFFVIFQIRGGKPSKPTTICFTLKGESGSVRRNCKQLDTAATEKCVPGKCVDLYLI